MRREKLCSFLKYFLARDSRRMRPRPRAFLGRAGASHRKSAVAAAAPASCAAMNPGASAGRIPANVSLAARASVTAGFANDVDEVNQYAAVMYAPTAKGVTSGRRREQPQMTAKRPNVATNSLKSCALPARPRLWRGEGPFRPPQPRLFVRLSQTRPFVASSRAC